MECIVGGIEAGKLTCPECRVPIESPPQLAVRVSQYQQTHQMSRDNFRAPEENYEHNIAPYESGEEEERLPNLLQQNRNAQHRALELAGGNFVRNGWRRI
jgi:hypothetical protein